MRFLNPANAQLSQPTQPAPTFNLHKFTPMEAPVPSNEFERVIELSELDLDYSNLEENLEDLTNLAARITGTEISLINLIDNYTQWVDVEVKVEEAENKDENNSLNIKIEDTGVGMPPEKVNEIMQGGTQSEGGTKREKGYGFGLALVHHLVQKAEGKMEVRSKEGEGTTFEIKLPV